MSSIFQKIEKVEKLAVSVPGESPNSIVWKFPDGHKYFEIEGIKPTEVDEVLLQKVNTEKDRFKKKLASFLNEYVEVLEKLPAPNIIISNNIFRSGDTVNLSAISEMSEVTFEWMSSSGSFSNRFNSSTVFTCPTVESETFVTIKVKSKKPGFEDSDYTEKIILVKQALLDPPTIQLEKTSFSTTDKNFTTSFTITHPETSSFEIYIDRGFLDKTARTFTVSNIPGTYTIYARALASGKETSRFSSASVVVS